jgi:hypothetical protein
MMSPMATVYISIGNSDDKLTQGEWAEYYRAVNLTLRSLAAKVHGQWVSEPASAWQNACWCVEFAEDEVVNRDGRQMPRVEWVRTRLSELAQDYRQDSIKWDETPVPEFLSGKS